MRVFLPLTSSLFLLTVITLISLSNSQAPYTTNQMFSANTSSVLAMWISPTSTLIRIVNKKYQILTYQMVKGIYSLTGVKQLNTNADEIQFSADGTIITYRFNLQIQGQYVYKVYRIVDGIYHLLNNDGNVAGMKPTKNLYYMAYYWRNGGVGVYFQGANYVYSLYQNLPFPEYNGVLELNQLSFTFTQNVTASTVFQPLPIFQKQISNIYWSAYGDILLVVYNRDTYIVIYKNVQVKKLYIFQTLDYPTSKIYAPLISANCSKILIPTQGKIYDCDYENMESKGGQYVLNSVIITDLIPRTFLSSFDFNVVIVANQTDIVVLEWTGKIYQQKWRVKFNADIQSIAFNEGVHLLVSLKNKEGIYDFVSCIKYGKNCTANQVINVNSSTNTTNSTNKLSSMRFGDDFNGQRDDKPHNQDYLTIISLGLNAVLIVLIICLFALGTVAYCKLKREGLKVVDVEKSSLQFDKIQREQKLRNQIEESDQNSGNV